jgi:DDE superfamily endonuclease/Helix-turn-helix of DDE superfamily endonuclease
LLLERIGLPHSNLQKQAADMYHTTGLTRARFSELCERIEEIRLSPGMRRWPPVLGLRKSVMVTMTYLRRNRAQAEIAEDYGVSQPTVSRAISAVTPLLVTALAGLVPAAPDLHDGGSYFIDGTLLPCWTWRAHPELRSGKHRATGMKVLLACTPDGRPAWISGPADGRHHDMGVLHASGLTVTGTPSVFCGDTGFLGSGMITPVRKPKHRELKTLEKQYNQSITRIRWVVEQAIANFKTWRILHTDYRRPIGTFPETISAVTALHFYKYA